MRTLVLLACIGAAGCGHRMQAAGNAWANCELGKLPSTLESAIVEVASILMAGSDQTWQSDLTQLGVQLGSQQLGCVVEAVGAGIKGKMKKGQAAPEYVEAARRSDAWLARGKE